jgi:hypothetical protein
MEYSIFAGIARAKGLEAQSREAYRFAYELEKKAALQTTEKEQGESRAMLLRSAAALALKAGLYKESDSLIELCLAENPPRWIISELQEIKTLIDRAEQTGEKEKVTRLTGILTNINSLESEIILEDENGKNIYVLVPKNFLSDVVQKHWSKKVAVEARETPHGVMVLKKISAAA